MIRGSETGRQALRLRAGPERSRSAGWVERRQIDDIVRVFRRATRLRADALLGDFMPRAYGAIRLSCVSPALGDTVTFAKVVVGAMITLLDDMADRPDLHEPVLLREAAFVPAEPERIDWSACPTHRRTWLEAVVELGVALRRLVHELPHGRRLWPWLTYDFGRCHLSMAYSSLIKDEHDAISAAALAETQHQNMTVSLAGLVDLMAAERVDWRELGAMRAVFDEAQRATRISNVLSTFERERAEGDVTNELGARIAEGETRAAAEAALSAEWTQRVERVRRARVTSFDVGAYAGGLERVHRLHLSLQGQI